MRTIFNKEHKELFDAALERMQTIKFDGQFCSAIWNIADAWDSDKKPCKSYHCWDTLSVKITNWINVEMLNGHHYFADFYRQEILKCKHEYLTFSDIAAAREQWIKWRVIPSFDRNFTQNEELQEQANDAYTEGVKHLALYHNVHRNNDIDEGVIDKNTSIYNYLHEAINFDQLCEDVAEEMKR